MFSHLDFIIQLLFWLQVQELGLAAEYRQHARLAKFVKKCMAIGYLPVAVVNMNFTALCQTRSTQRLIQRFPRLADFVAYMRTNYVTAQSTISASQMVRCSERHGPTNQQLCGM